jgi:two-component system sensor histidine kinase PhoQ
MMAPGIADPQAMLERGVRADEQVPGYGIGLAMISDIVHAYGGELSISRSPLGGALFSVRLPA